MTAVTRPRKIIHVDMDAFYAAVEQRDNPALRNRPVIVGGTPDGRGVVATASYEARRFGIHSAMPAAHAKRLCPDAIFVRPRFDVYQRVSRTILGIYREYTELVEPLALDEAYLDVTLNKKQTRMATGLAAEIRSRIFRFTGLTASAGVGPNKFVAKAASGFRKPDALTVVAPERVDSFLLSLSPSAIPGVGAVTQQAMEAHGIHTMTDLRSHTEAQLSQWFGKRGVWFYQACRGVDERPVNAYRERKSLGVERTFPSDVKTFDTSSSKVAMLSELLHERLYQRGIQARTLVLKAKFNDFSVVSRQTSAIGVLQNPESIAEAAMALLQEFQENWKPIRLLGLSVRGLADEGTPRSSPQLSLF